MFKKIPILFLCIILLCLSGCSDYNDSPSIISGNDPEAYKDTLAAVLNNKKSFITEDGEASYLKSYKIRMASENETIPASPSEYTYVDFDGDTFDELLINISPEDNVYLILRHNGYDVFGYEADAEAMSVIKSDGSFSGSNSSPDTVYGRLSFQNRKMKITQLAVCNNASGTYQIDGMLVSYDDYQAYVLEWEQKSDVVWTRITTNNTEPTESSTVESTAPSYSIDATEQETSGVCIDLNQYVLVAYSGYSGAGSASVSLDKEQFLQDNNFKVFFKDQNAKAEYYAETGDASSAAEALFQMINKVSLSAKDTLSNGDRLTLEWNINKNKIAKYFAVDLTRHNEAFTVSGLTDPEKFNPMDYICVSYTGTAPCGQLLITIDTSSVTDSRLADKVKQACGEKNFTYSGTVYAPGDKVDIIYSPVDLSDPKSRAKYIDSYGLIPTTTQKSFTLSGFNFHPTSLEQIDLRILSDADSLCRRKVAEDDYLQVKDISRSRVYYVTPSPSEYTAANSVWSLYVVYKVDATAEFWNLSNAPAITKDISYYYVIEYQSVQLNSDRILTHNGYSTLINPIGRNGGAGFVYWEKDGMFFDAKPDGLDDSIIEHCCYPDGFATLAEVDSTLRGKGSKVEMKDY